MAHQVLRFHKANPTLKNYNLQNYNLLNLSLVFSETNLYQRQIYLEPKNSLNRHQLLNQQQDYLET
jgi:hypothetical protein